MLAKDSLAAGASTPMTEIGLYKRARPGPSRAPPRLPALRRGLERVLEDAEQLAALAHGRENVGVAVEFAGDEDFRQRGPIRHLGKRLALFGIGQRVDDLERVPKFVEEFDRLVRETAARRALGALAVDEDRMIPDIFFNRLFDVISHGFRLPHVTCVFNSTACRRPSLSASPSAFYTTRCWSIRVMPSKPFDATETL